MQTFMVFQKLGNIDQLLLEGLNQNCNLGREENFSKIMARMVLASNNAKFCSQRNMEKAMKALGRWAAPESPFALG